MTELAGMAAVQSSLAASRPLSLTVPLPPTGFSAPCRDATRRRSPAWHGTLPAGSSCDLGALAFGSVALDYEYADHCC